VLFTLMIRIFFIFSKFYVMSAGCFEISSYADYLKTCECGPVIVKCFSLLHVTSQRYVNPNRKYSPCQGPVVSTILLNSFYQTRQRSIPFILSMILIGLTPSNTAIKLTHFFPCIMPWSTWMRFCCHEDGGSTLLRNIWHCTIQ
jgi:hypothetical protein